MTREFVENIDDSVSREFTRMALQKPLVEGQKAANHYWGRQSTDSKAISPLLENVTQDGWRIVYDGEVDMLLLGHFMAQNNACFEGGLPDIPLV